MEFLTQSLVTITVISIVSLLVPKGKYQSIIKWVFSIITTLVIITPFSNLVVKTRQNNTTCQLKNDYLDEFFQRSTESSKNLLKSLLKNKGIVLNNIYVDYVLENNSIKYKKVQIDLKNAVINSDKSNIYIMQETELVVKSVFGESVLVDFYE